MRCISTILSLVLFHWWSVEAQTPAERTLNPGETIHDTDTSGYSKSFNQNKGRGTNDTCYPCISGAFWKDDRRAVVRILVFKEDRTLMCTGTLMNNTIQDGKPYILTSQHCIASQTDADNALFTFNHYDVACDVNATRQANSLHGGVLQASSYAHDFALVELNNRIPPSFNVYYAGWDISDEYLDEVSCIHHPLAGIQQISLTHGELKRGDYIQSDKPTRARNSFWNIERWDVGTTEAGSSGAPLFNPKHKVVGTLAGGKARCGFPYDDYFSMLSKSWRPDVDATQQLHYWLDPAATGRTFIDGFDPFEPVTCDTLTNVLLNEQTGMVSDPSGSGYLTGCNGSAIASWAEKFNNSDSIIISGARISVGSSNADANGGLLVQVLSSSDGFPIDVLSETYIPNTKLHLGINYVEFYPLVHLRGEFFISYTPACNGNNNFAVEQTIANSRQHNTAYGKRDQQWIALQELTSDNTGTSLSIEAIVCKLSGEINTEAHAKKIIAYPNPVSDQLTIEVPVSADAFVELKVLNMNGHQQNISWERYKGHLVVETSSLTGGIYILTLSTDSGLLHAKFAKQ